MADFHHGDDGRDPDHNTQTGQHRTHDVATQRVESHPENAIKTFHRLAAALSDRRKERIFNCGLGGLGELANDNFLTFTQ